MDDHLKLLELGLFFLELDSDSVVAEDSIFFDFLAKVVDHFIGRFVEGQSFLGVDEALLGGEKLLFDLFEHLLLLLTALH